MLMMCLPPSLLAADPDGSRRGVMLVHGLGRSARAMRPMERALRRAGYRVHSLDYPSTRYPVDTLRERFLKPAVERFSRSLEGGTMHFVTHSLGGILVRSYLERYPLNSLGRVVMLAPPSRGSEIPDKVRFLKYLMGPAFLELGTGPDSVPNRLAAPEYPCGVIAGKRSIDPWFSLLIPGADDGKVSVERTKFRGMRDFRVVAATHPFIMRHRGVIRHTLHFLEHGRFEPPSVDENASK
jgi:pimeloyl-ACP methyl ester carboxylesterase